MRDIDIITSTSGNRIKNLIKLKNKAGERRNTRLFLVEGKRLYSEVPKELLEETYVSKSFYDALGDKDREELLLGRDYFVVADSVFSKISDTKTPQGIMAVVKQPGYQPSDVIASEGIKIVLENIQDPGNLGTIFRAAEGAGASGVIMSRDTVDLFSPKVVRSTMGTIFRMPFCFYEDTEELIGAFREKNVKSYAAYLDESQRYDKMNFAADKAVAFFIGNEGNGLRRETALNCDERIIIPMGGKLESLNAAMAATILMYEAARQRGF